MRFYVIGSIGSFHNTIAMAERETRDKILPKRYSNWDTNSSKSDTNIWEQASFTEQLGSTSWYECTKCAPMPSGIEYQCCKEMEGVAKCVVDNESYPWITDHEQLKVICLKQRLFIYSPCYDEHDKRRFCTFTAIHQVMIVILPCSYIKILHIFYKSYRLAAYQQFIYWTH